MKQTETLLSVRARPFQGTSQTGKNGDLVGASPESFDNRAGGSGPREGHALHALEPSGSVPCSLNWQGLSSVWGHPVGGDSGTNGIPSVRRLSCSIGAVSTGDLTAVPRPGTVVDLNPGGAVTADVKDYLGALVGPSRPCERDCVEGGGREYRYLSSFLQCGS